MTVAYFCAEFGIDSNLPTYAGGLGILAGDTLLEAARQDMSMVGIGLLYKGTKFYQRLDESGWQYEQASEFHPEDTSCIRPVERFGKTLEITCHFGSDEVYLRAYRQRLGDNTTLYFLATDFEKNSPPWREVLDAEYSGGDEGQFKAQLILGVGGIKLLNSLGISPTHYHFNEGRPIFCYWQLLADELKKGVDFELAKTRVKEKIVYVNHTLVAAGNLVYSKELVLKYALAFAKKNKVPVDELFEPGLTERGFEITKFALKVSRVAGSVSKPHFQAAKREWKGFKWVKVTNGIFLPRWQRPEFANTLLSADRLWQLHQNLKTELMREAYERTGFAYDPSWLVIGWARRISDYKKLNVIFEDVSRLALIVKNSSRPVQLLIAGKAHFGDDIAKKHIQEVIGYMKGDLSGYAMFVPNYDIELAHKMVSGCDIWLNTPEFSKEACGTSGMKAIANGVLNMTVADGWAAEVDWEGIGWVLDHQRLSQSFYEILDYQVAPLFYERDGEIPHRWIEMMQKSIKLSFKYSSTRMLEGYTQKLYK